MGQGQTGRRLTAAASLAMALGAGNAAPAQAQECSAVTRIGWYTCVRDGDVGAVPLEMLDMDIVDDGVHSVLIACLARPVWKVWGKGTLVVAFLDGGPWEKEREAAVEVATTSPGEERPAWTRYEAVIDHPAEKSWKGEVGHERARVEGEAALRLIRQVSNGTERWWTWRAPGSEAVHRIERRTLAGPAQAVLEACGEDGT